MRVQNCFERNYAKLDSFVISMCVSGIATVVVNGITEVVSKGETILLAATTGEIYFFAKQAKFLEVYISE